MKVGKICIAGITSHDDVGIFVLNSDSLLTFIRGGIACIKGLYVVNTDSEINATYICY